MITNIRAMRQAQAAADKRFVPSGAARMQAFRSQVKTRKAAIKGENRIVFEGMATVFEQPYEMYDFWGPYTEIVSAGAADATLAASPDVAFLVNHRGVTMARTTSGTLELAADESGMSDIAYCNPARSDVMDQYHAVQDGDVTEQSFAFMITLGAWSPDYTEYRINTYDIDRGDVSNVNFGANPYTSVAARSSELLSALEHLSPGAAREAMRRLRAAGFLDEEGEPTPALTRAIAAPEPAMAGGRGLTLLARQLELDA